MIYIVGYSYTPNSAACIRLRSLISGFAASLESIKIVFFESDRYNSRLVSEFSNISIKNYWRDGVSPSKLRRFFSLLLHMLSFCFHLRPGDDVLVMGFSEMLPILFLRQKCKIYYEITENPEVSLSISAKGTSVQKFINYCKRLSGLFVISESLKNYFVEKGIEREKIHVINMTVDPDRFRGIKKNAEKRYIAYCGTASNNKDGVDQLIKAFAIFARTHPGIALQIIGKTPNSGQAFNNLNLVKDFHLERQVVFLGQVDSSLIPQLLVNAEVLALDRPDNIQAKYGFPTKLGEYLMTANPVVVTSVGDIPLFLSDNVSAYLSAPDNPSAFASKLEEAIDHPKDARRVGLEGRRVALNSFNGKNEGRKMISIIQCNHK